MTKQNQELIRMLLSDERARQAEFYNDEHFTPKERKDLAKTLNETMWEEIGLLRTAIKKFHGASTRGKDAKEAQRLEDDLQVLGISCTRLARVMQVNKAVMQVNKALRAGQPEPMDSAISQAIAALLDDMKQKEGESGVTQLS